MQILDPISIPPFALDNASLTNAARVWDTTGVQVESESAAARRGGEAARRGALQISSLAAGVRALRNATSSGVAAANPAAELGTARSAQGNVGPGRSSIERAAQRSGDPRATVPGFDPNRPFRELDPALRSARSTRDAVRRQQGAADSLEKRLDDPPIAR